MSIITYNSISLPYPFTTDYRQESVPEESGTDKMLTKFDIAVQTIINSSYLTTITPGLTGSVAGSTPTGIMNYIRENLLMKKRRLSVMTNGVEMIPYDLFNAGTVDAKNGPEPLYCNITQLTDTTFLVQYRIVAHYWESKQVVTGTGTAAFSVTPNPILSHRWTETVDMDDCVFTTRTREGKYTIASNNVIGFTADMLRPRAANLGLPPGFLRISSRYTISPDGLSINYQQVDREQFKMPPAPAYKASGFYKESAPEKASNHRVLECGCKLKGSKITSQNQLVNIASFIVVSKVFLNAGLIGAAPGPIIIAVPGGNSAVTPTTSVSAVALKALIRMTFHVNVNMYENEVEAYCMGLAAASTRRYRPTGMHALFGPGDSNIARKCFTPLSDGIPLTPDRPEYFLFGTANLFLQAAAYYDPSLAATVVKKDTRQFTTGREVGTAGLNP